MTDLLFDVWSILVSRCGFSQVSLQRQNVGALKAWITYNVFQLQKRQFSLSNVDRYTFTLVKSMHYTFDSSTFSTLGQHLNQKNIQHYLIMTRWITLQYYINKDITCRYSMSDIQFTVLYKGNHILYTKKVAWIWVTLELSTHSFQHNLCCIINSYSIKARAYVQRCWMHNI